jgi:hypothetical protein
MTPDPTKRSSESDFDSGESSEVDGRLASSDSSLTEASSTGAPSNRSLHFLGGRDAAFGSQLIDNLRQALAQAR